MRAEAAGLRRGGTGDLGALVLFSRVTGSESRDRYRQERDTLRAAADGARVDGLGR